MIICNLQFRLACMNICRTICINGNISISCPNIPVFINAKRTLCRRKTTVSTNFGSINRSEIIIRIIPYKSYFDTVTCCNITSNRYTIIIDNHAIIAMAQYRLIICNLQFRAICMNIRCAICIYCYIAISCIKSTIYFSISCRMDITVIINMETCRIARTTYPQTIFRQGIIGSFITIADIKTFIILYTFLCSYLFFFTSLCAANLFI